MRVVMVAALLLLSPAARAASEPDPDAPASPSPATCGEESRQEQPPWGRLYVSRFYPRQTFAARSAPTELLQVAELQLLKQGYVAIGWIEVTQFKLLHPAGQPDEPTGVTARDSPALAL